MSKEYGRKPQYKSREEQRGRFGFEYVKANINYRTEIPPLPEKPRHRPDEKIRDKKVEELQKKISDAKEERRLKKDQIKAVNQVYEERHQQLKNNVTLGRKCIEVLYTDLDFINDEIGKINGKFRGKLNRIDSINDIIRDLKAQTRPPKRVYKKLEEMTISQLDAERREIEYQMSTRSLTKKEETELNAQLIKIGRVRADHTRTIPQQAPKVDVSPQVAKHQAEIETLRGDLEKLKVSKGKLVTQRHDVEWKIQCIRQDVARFFVEMNEIADQEEHNEDARKLTEESKVLKQNIYDLREEIAKVEKEFTEKVHEYEYEQEKVKWISWATKVQEEKREEWETEKAERKRQKLREKEKGDKKEGEVKEQGKPEQKEERKRPNRNQKEIDNCAFLIDYCKRLYPSATQAKKQAQKKAVNIQEQLKKGAWAKQKGVQIIQSKKAKRDEEEEAPVKPQRRQNQPKEEEEPLVTKFTHDYFVQKYFENAKIIPPSAADELEKIIKELEDKVEYYLSHPDEGVESKFEKDRKFIDKNTAKPQGKDTKSKGSAKVINTEDFPSIF